MKFNINNYVKVKLTELGEKILEDNHRELKKQFPKLHDYTPLQKDEDGYVKFQMWNLMQTFGKHINLGSIPPFSTDIVFDGGDFK